MINETESKEIVVFDIYDTKGKMPISGTFVKVGSFLWINCQFYYFLFLEGASFCLSSWRLGTRLITSIDGFTGLCAI
jgi:uncharacterized membrane protein YoaT (DUF817 family)